MRTPWRASIAARRRGSVQFGRSATGASNKGVATRKAVSLFTGTGPGATLAFSAATSPLAKSLRHRRIVSSRTPNAAAILGLAQPASVSSTARPVRLSTIAGAGKSQKGGALFVARGNRRLSCHAIPLRIGTHSESYNPSVGQPGGTCLGTVRYQPLYLGGFRDGSYSSTPRGTHPARYRSRPSPHLTR